MNINMFYSLSPEDSELAKKCFTKKLIVLDAKNVC
jgi:hypothetical protein